MPERRGWSDAARKAAAEARQQKSEQAQTHIMWDAHTGVVSKPTSMWKSRRNQFLERRGNLYQPRYK